MVYGSRQRMSTGFSGLRILMAVFLVLVVSVFVGLASNRQAHAASGTLYHGQVVLPGQPFEAWFGSFIVTADGSITYCAAENGVWNPSLGDYTYQEDVKVDVWNGFTKHANGSVDIAPTIGQPTIGRMAYVMSKYGPTTDDRQASVIKALILHEFQSTWPEWQPEIDSRAAEFNVLWNDAIQNAGPYTSNMTIQSALNNRTGSVGNVGVYNGGGIWQAGYNFSITLTGNAHWDEVSGYTLSSDKKTLSGLTANVPLSFNWIADGPGVVTAKQNVTGLPDSQLTVKRANQVMEAQDLFVAGATVSASNEVQVELTWPKLTSDAKPHAKLGEPFYDVAHIDGLADNETATYELMFEAYGPLPEGQTAVCNANTLLFTSPKQVINKNGSYQSQTTSTDKTGVVYWVESLYKDGVEIARGECGESRETTRIVVDAPATGIGAALSNPLVIVATGLVAALIVWRLASTKRLSKSRR